MDAIVLLRYDVDPVWAWLQVPVLALAWVAPFAWFARRWAVAGVCLLATLGGLWGYFYLSPLVALVLAVVTLYRAAPLIGGWGMASCPGAVRNGCGPPGVR